MVILIVIVALAGTGLAILLAEHLKRASLQQQQAKAIYLAQAGVMQAAYDVRFDGPGGTDDNNIRLGEYPVPADLGAPGPADDDVFILGGQAGDFLLAAMIPATFATAPAGSSCGGTQRHRLQDWTLRNMLQSDTPPDGIVVGFNQVSVQWDPVGAGEGVVRLDINGNGADWRSIGCAPIGSGVPIAIPTQTIAASDLWTRNQIWFATTTMTTKNWIEITFTMTDGSTRRARFVPANPTQSSANFTIKAVGEVRRGQLPFPVWRRLQAEYRLNDDDVSITDLQEIATISSDPSPVSDRPGWQELKQRQP